MLSKAFYTLIRKIVNLFSPGDRVSLGLSIVQSVLHQTDSVEAYKIRRRIFDRFFKSYPMLYSHEVMRIHGFVSLLASLDKVPGDIVECGVGRGRFLTVFVCANAFYKLNKKVYGFDSFEGFPVATSQDFGTRVVKEEKISGWDDVSPDMIHYVLKNDKDAEGSHTILNNGGTNDTILIKGFFSETLSSNLPHKISFLHLDADLYESTRDALVECLPRMSRGAIIVFDELHEKEKWPGVQRAVDEILKPLNLTPTWDAVLQRFVVTIS